MSKLYRLLSSVRLAVPLMLVLGAVVAIGTVLESKYSAAYAKLLIYDAFWFYGLLALLGLNILCAALSRRPWKARHTGFVTTHAGMLLMLGGAFITAYWGIDGELKIEEGGSAAVVGLPGLELLILENNKILARADVPRYVRPQSSAQLKWLNERLGHGLTFKSYQPFTLPDEEFVDAPEDVTAAPAIGFWLRSQFFNTSEWLHAKDRNDIEMGPARLRLIVDGAVAPTTSAKAELKVFTHPERKFIRSLSMDELKRGAVQLGSAGVRLVKIFEHASVQGNRLVEKGGLGINPAVELAVTTAFGTFREVSFANFTDFSLVKDPRFAFRFEYTPGTPRRPDSNLIEFHVGRDNQLRLELYKRGQLVQSQTIREGSVVETPWMGMKLVVARFIPKSLMRPVVKPLSAPTKGVLPPSAFEIEIASRPGESFWISEGDTLEVPTQERIYQVNYAAKNLRLPFSVQLDRFVKEEYPGTDKALSFESHIRVPEANEAAVISMNNPLVRAGFTLYQSSFQILPDRPPVSILSVNRDPGRYVKYLGGIVTSLGILIYTLMRSRFWLWLRGSP